MKLLSQTPDSASPGTRGQSTVTTASGYVKPPPRGGGRRGQCGEPRDCNAERCLSTPITSGTATFLAGPANQSSPDVTRCLTNVRGRNESHEISGEETALGKVSRVAYKN